MPDISPQKRKKMLQLVEKWERNRASKGDGGCWALPLEALNKAGAQMPCRTCGTERLYVWGRVVNEGSLAAGDIIQIKGVASYIGRERYKADHRSTEFEFGTSDEPLHSMIVMNVGKGGRDGPVVKVAHQWKGQPVFYSWLRLGTRTGTGTVHYYRPQSPKK